MRKSLLVPIAFCLLAPLSRAADEQPDENVFRHNTEEVLQGAATLAGAGCQGGPGTAIVIAGLLRGDELHLWKLQESDTAPLLTPALLKRVKDSTEIRIDDAAFETEAYCEAVLKASFTSVDAFANTAHRGVTFADLFTEPGKYRGEVIHYEGKIRRIRRMDAPLMLSGKGIKDLYECWLFGSDDGSNPVCLICTELPEGVQPGEHLGIAASFDAYFFKRYRYQAVGSKPGQAREAPLFIGRSFVVPKRAVAATGDEYTAGSKTLLLIFLGLVGTTFVVAFALHMWFRRGDRQVRARIEAMRSRDVADPGVPGMPGSTPSAN
jgi:hypothetical protein